MNEILIHCVKLGASDITFQTDEPIIAEIYGRLCKITRRKLSNIEVGEVMNAMYGPNATTLIMSGKDLIRIMKFDLIALIAIVFVSMALAAKWKAMMAMQITARTIPTDPPKLDSMNLPPAYS